MNYDPESDEEVEDELEDEPSVGEMDPHVEEEDEPEEILPANVPFQPESWHHEAIVDHPQRATRSSDEPQYAPFMDEPLRFVSGARYIPVGCRKEAQYFELIYIWNE